MGKQPKQNLNNIEIQSNQNEPIIKPTVQSSGSPTFCDIVLKFLSTQIST